MARKELKQEWWLQEGQHRDYYYVEDEDGYRYWLFRAGHRRQVAIGALEWGKRRVVDPAQPVAGIELRRLRQDVAIAFAAGADDHLRALAGWREPWGRRAGGTVWPRLSPLRRESAASTSRSRRGAFPAPA